MLAAVLVISCAMLSFEILQTVVMSLQVFPDSAFLVISLSMLGLASGSSLAFALGRRRPVDPLRWMWAAAMGFSIALVAAMAITSHTHALLALIVMHAAPFVFLGLFLALAFGGWPERINQTYFVDLVGAGLGCVLVVVLLNRLASAGLTILAIAAVGAVGATIIASMVSRRHLMLSIGTLLAVLALAPWQQRLFSFAPEPGKFYGQLLARGSRGGTLDRQKWSYIGRLDSIVPGEAVTDFWFARAAKEILDQGGDVRLLFSNGYNWSFMVDFKDRERDHDALFARSPQQAPYLFTHAPDVLNLGSGGGVDVYLAIANGARTATGVEINPLMIEACTRWHPHFWDGVWAKPGVALRELDARTYVNITNDTYDVITLNAVDTAGAEVSALSVNFLYTTEAFARYLELLRPDGVIFLTRQRDQLPRALSAAAAALKERGDRDVPDHFVVLGTGELLSAAVYARALDGAQRRVIEDRVRDGYLGGEIQYLPGTALRSNVFGQYFAAIANGDESSHFARSSQRIDPTTDDNPYFYQVERPFFGSRAGKQLVVILLFVVGLGSLLIFLPLRGFPLPKSTPLGGTLVYFVSIGVGFMLAEICLIQRLSLFLGHPAYSVTVTLLSMLLFSGIGSMVAGRIEADRNRLLVVALGAITTGLVGYAFLTSALAYSRLEDLTTRVVLVVAWMAPVSFFLGMPFPLKLRSLEGPETALVPWAFGVNGVSSVAGSVIAVMLAMNFGFRIVLLAAAGCYAVALVTHLLRGR